MFRKGKHNDCFFLILCQIPLDWIKIRECHNNHHDLILLKLCFGIPALFSVYFLFYYFFSGFTKPLITARNMTYLTSVIVSFVYFSYWHFLTVFHCKMGQHQVCSKHRGQARIKWKINIKSIVNAQHHTSVFTHKNGLQWSKGLSVIWL